MELAGGGLTPLRARAPLAQSCVLALPEAACRCLQALVLAPDRHVCLTALLTTKRLRLLSRCRVESTQHGALLSRCDATPTRHAASTTAGPVLSRRQKLCSDACKSASSDVTVRLSPAASC